MKKSKPKNRGQPTKKEFREIHRFCEPLICGYLRKDFPEKLAPHDRLEIFHDVSRKFKDECLLGKFKLPPRGANCPASEILSVGQKKAVHKWHRKAAYFIALRKIEEDDKRLEDPLPDDDSSLSLSLLIKPKVESGSSVTAAQKAILAEAIEQLSEIRRRAVTFIFYRNLENKDIAEEMGITTNYLKSLKYHAIKQIKEFLSNYDEFDDYFED